MRLSIEITPEQHQCLKASAALAGKTIKAYVLERVMADIAEGGTSELQALLKRRVAQAKQGSLSSKSVDQIVDDVLREDPRR